MLRYLRTPNRVVVVIFSSSDYVGNDVMVKSKYESVLEEVIEAYFEIALLSLRYLQYIEETLENRVQVASLWADIHN